LQHFINNENVPSISGKVFTNINPSTEEKIGDVAEAEKVRKIHILGRVAVISAKNH